MECGFHDARPNFDRLIASADPLVTPLAFQDEQQRSHAATSHAERGACAERAGERGFLLREAVLVPDFLTQRQRSEATISGRDAAILVESASAALRRSASQWPLR